MKSYEDLGHIDYRRHRPSVLEAYNGADIVAWHDTIGRQIEAMAEEASEGNNVEYHRLLMKFLTEWETNEPTGSLNIEVIQLLQNAASWASQLPWNFKSYFASLNNQLKRLVASIQSLPTVPMNPPEKKKGGRRAAPQPDDDHGPDMFGPEPTEKPSPEDEEAMGNDIKSAIDMANAAKRP